MATFTRRGAARVAVLVASLALVSPLVGSFTATAAPADDSAVELRAVYGPVSDRPAGTDTDARAVSIDPAALPVANELPNTTSARTLVEPFDPAQPASGGEEPAAPTVPAGITPFAVNESATVGLLYFNDAAGVSRVCSAAVINHPSQDVISTAGSCVYGSGGNGWHTNFRFVPGTRNGSAPYGIFTGQQPTSNTGWTVDRQTQYNWAFIRLHPNGSGQKVAQLTGSNGYYYGGTQVRAVTHYGYNANVQQYLQGTSYAVSASAINGLNGVLAGQALGGPWLADFDSSTSRGRIFSQRAAVSPSGTVTQGPYQNQFWYTVFSGF